MEFRKYLVHGWRPRVSNEDQCSGPVRPSIWSSGFRFQLILNGARSALISALIAKFLSRGEYSKGFFVENGERPLVLAASMKIKARLTPKSLNARIDRFLDLAAGEIRLIQRSWDPCQGTPVFMVKGRVYLTGLDRVDAGIPVRLCDSAIRCDGRPYGFPCFARRGA